MEIYMVKKPLGESKASFKRSNYVRFLANALKNLKKAKMLRGRMLFLTAVELKKQENICDYVRDFFVLNYLYDGTPKAFSLF
jgi:hypothetical protein